MANTPICLGPESFGGEWWDLWNVDIYLNLHLSERGNYICDREQSYVHLHLSHSAKIRSGLWTVCCLVERGREWVVELCNAILCICGIFCMYMCLSQKIMRSVLFNWGWVVDLWNAILWQMMTATSFPSLWSLRQTGEYTRDTSYWNRQTGKRLYKQTNTLRHWIFLI